MIALTLLLLASPEADLQVGNEAFWKGEYELAQRSFKSLVEARPNSPEAWYNLGTTEARLGHMGPAIYALEQALLLKPNEEDVIHNLEAIREKTLEQAIETEAGGGRLILPGDDDTGTGLLTAVPQERLLWTFGTAWILLFALLIILRRLNRPELRAGVAFASVLSALLALGSGGLFLGRHLILSNMQHGVVLSETARLRSGPGPQYPSSHKILGGVRLQIRGEHEDWLRVTLPDGGESWLPKREIGVLRAP